MTLSKITYRYTINIYFLSIEDEGRESPVYTGYRPSFAFNTKIHFCGDITLQNKE